MRLFRRITLLTIIGVLGTGGAAFAYQGQGNGNGWSTKDNKPVRGCPTPWTLYQLDPNNSNYADLKLVDLNGDGWLCTKPASQSTPGLFEFSDNTSNAS
jgi:hypothetical protein